MYLITACMAMHGLIFTYFPSGHTESFFIIGILHEYTEIVNTLYTPISLHAYLILAHVC